MSSRKITNIQILRGLAAVWVVIFHAFGLTAYADGDRHGLAGVGRYGYFGVDVFFVLSGFVIYHSVFARKIGAGEFFRRRLERIVPPYLVLTVVLFIAMWLRPSLFHTLKASFDHLVRSIFYLSFTGYPNPVIYTGWTLEYEMLFYVSAAAALWFGTLAFKRLPIIMSAGVLIGVVSPKLFGTSGAYAFLTNPIVLEFCFGFFISSIFLEKKCDIYNIVALITALGAVALFDPGHRVIVAGLPSAVLLFSCMALNNHVTLPLYLKSPLCMLGDASYSIYLIQVFSLPLFDRLLHFVHGNIGANLFAVLATGFTVFVGWSFFMLVETPMLGALKHMHRRAADRRSGRVDPIALHQAEAERMSDRTG